MFLYQRTIPGLAINSYFIGDETAKEAVVIDPVRDVEEYMAIAEKNQMTITHILETHVHADFISGAKELKARLKNVPLIHCSGMGGKEWLPAYADREVKEGDQITLGALNFLAVHTPGHTPEHVMWVLEDNGEQKILFTGDFLFVGAVGRPDLLGEEKMRSLAHQLYQSVFEKLSSYPDSIQVMPAHGAGSLCGKALGNRPSSTLGEERKENVFLVKKPEEEWINALIQEMPQAPPYFLRMKKMNVKGASLLGTEVPGKHPLLPQEVQTALEKGGLCLDIRSKELFSQGHIPGAINIPFSPQLSNWAGWILPDSVPLILVANNEREISLAIDCLLLVGYDQIVGYLEGGMESWSQQDLPIAMLPFLPPEDLFDLLNQNKAPYILDVRTDVEWKAGHISGAHWLPLGQAAWETLNLSKEQPITVICGSGYRASIAASLLKKKGFQVVSNVMGGMSEWRARGFPTT